jgi:hypothetical protein
VAGERAAHHLTDWHLHDASDLDTAELLVMAGATAIGENRANPARPRHRDAR